MTKHELIEALANVDPDEEIWVGNHLGDVWQVTVENGMIWLIWGGAGQDEKKLQETYEDQVRSGMRHAYRYRGATASLLLDYVPGCDLITSVGTMRSQRRQGNATELLRLIAQEADREGRTLVLSVEPQEHEASADVIRRMYSRHGFVQVSEEEAGALGISVDSGMVRRPRGR